MAGKQSIENGKKGGRPKGAKNAATLEREAVNKIYKQRIRERADELFTLQMQLAKGCAYLYKTECTGTGKERKCKYKQVTDPEEIEKYLNGEFEEVDTGSGVDEAYYQITVDKPDGRTIDSMLDRGLGKTPNILTGGEDDEGKTQPILVKIIGKDGHGDTDRV